MEPNQQANMNPEGVQDTPMPSVEQHPSGDYTPAEGVERAPEVEVSDDLTLPSGTKDRTTEQFNKLKQQLADERTRRIEAEQYYSGINRSEVTPAGDKPLYDPNTGYVDITELERIRKENDNLAKKYRQVEDKFEKYLQKQQETEAFTAYPTLDPKSPDFDEVLNRSVRALITDSIINPRDYGGSELSMKKAADMVKELSKPVIKEVERIAKDRLVKELTPKEQASLDVGSRSDGRGRSALGEDVKIKTREGDMNSILERMKNLSN